MNLAELRELCKDMAELHSPGVDVRSKCCNAKIVVFDGIIPGCVRCGKEYTPPADPRPALANAVPALLDVAEAAQRLYAAMAEEPGWDEHVAQAMYLAGAALAKLEAK